MAKSLRSKWKRKMKAVKRVRYGEKESARLDKMIKDYKEDQQAKKEQGITDHRPQPLGKSPSFQICILKAWAHMLKKTYGRCPC